MTTRHRAGGVHEGHRACGRGGQSLRRRGGSGVRDHVAVAHGAGSRRASAVCRRHRPMAGSRIVVASAHHYAQPGADPDRGRGRRRGSTGARGSHPAGPNPHVWPRTRTAFGGRVVLRTPLGAADFEHHRAVGSARDLAASGRAAVTVIRGLLGSLHAVEPEEVVLDR